jgi:hypothetical protein
VETRGNEVRAACRETAAQVRQSAEEQLQRLTALETSKLAALQRQGDALKADLEVGVGGRMETWLLVFTCTSNLIHFIYSG